MNNRILKINPIYRYNAYYLCVCADINVYINEYIIIVSECVMLVVGGETEDYRFAIIHRSEIANLVLDEELVAEKEDASLFW